MFPRLSRPLVAFAAIWVLAPFVWAQTPIVAAPPAANPITEVAPLPQTPILGQEGLNSTLWVQTSAEASFAAQQAYRLATYQLDKALRDKNWSAAIEQTESARKLPPAIILDIDETVLDNSAYQARLVRDDAPYSSASWDRWVSQSAALAIPGAAKFLAYAARKGIHIFYVSNRGIGEEAATRENLRRVGLPVQGPDDHVLMNGEMPNWTSDKTTRRSFLAQKYRLLLLFGDDFNDFITAKPRSVAERLNLLAKYEPYLGERWILISNPLYGSWESAILNFENGLSREDILRRKYTQLRTQEPAVAVSLASPGAATATR
jgi:5'-nucleotidase (lipoprotein e(P4) family)